MKNENRMTQFPSKNELLAKLVTLESELLTNKDLSDAIFQHSDIAFFFVKVISPGEYIYEGVNKKHESVFKVKNEEISGKSPQHLVEHFGSEAIDYILTIYDECVRSKKPHISEFEVPVNDTKTWYLSRIAPVIDDENRVYRLIGSAIDISDRVKAENDAKTGKRRSEKLFDSAPVPLWEEDFTDLHLFLNEITANGKKNLRRLLDSDFSLILKCSEKVKILDVNQATLALHEASTKDELLGNLDKIFTEQSLNVFKEEVIAFWENNHDIQLEGAVRTLKGDIRFVSLSLKIDFTEDGRYLALVATPDITQKKKYENQLRMKDAAIENSLNAFDIVNEEGLFVYVNKAYVNMWGYESSEEIVGSSPANHCMDESMPEKIIATLKEKGEHEFELDAKKKDGTPFKVLMYARLAHDENGNEIYPTTSIDITERKRIEAERQSLSRRLQQAQKMEAIGTLAGGIAHDFNNILSSVLGFTGLAMEDAPSGSLQKEHLQEVYAAGLRAKDLVSQILAFARQSDDDIHPLQPSTIVKEVLKLLRSTVPVTVDVRQSIDSNSHVLANPTQLHQVLLNLCTNSSQAMEQEGGILEVSLKDILIDHSSKWHNIGLIPGKYVEIQVTDTGEGIPEKNFERIFEPYFTTKDIGEGTGMGLAMVKGIVESYDGEVVVKSEAGQTVFNVYLPVTAGKSSEFKPQPSLINGGHETILLVDDEPPITRMGSRLLQRLGYTVITQTCSLKALELFRKEPGRFDLVITDMTMPKLTGDQLAQKLKNIRQNIPVIICTGYSNKLTPDRAADLGIDAFTYKPFTRDDIAKVIRKTLDGRLTDVKD